MQPIEPMDSGLKDRVGLGTTVLFIALLVLAALQNIRHPVLLDDAYITFRSARNLARGEGLVFNPGEKVLSTTAPGYAIVLAGLTRLGIETVAAAKIVSTLSLLAAVLLLFRLCADMGCPIVGFSAGFILCFLSDLAGAWGNETQPLLALFVLTWWFWHRRSAVSCATVASLGCMVRPDFALAALLFACAFILKSRKDFIKYALVGMALSALWLVFLYWLCGSAIPRTMGVKMNQGILAASGSLPGVGWMSMARGFRWFLRRNVFNPASGVLIVVGGFLMLSNMRLLVAMLWAAAHLLAYYLLHVPGYPWYYYPLWLALALCAGVCIEFFALRGFGQEKNLAERGWGGRALVLGLTFYCAMNLFGPYNEDPWSRDKCVAYAEIAEAIRQHVRPGESVMMPEIGEIGYMTDCRVVDTYGLVHNVTDRSVFADPTTVIEHFRPDFVLNIGWVRYCEPGYVENALLGKCQSVLTLSDGRPVTYRQIDYRRVGKDFLPVLMKRVE